MRHRSCFGSTASNEPHGGLFAIGIFLFFGATVAALAGTSLAWAGTLLDRMWVLNTRAQRRLAPIGKEAGIAFLLLSVIMIFSGIGWFRRRRWAWNLTIAIFAAQFCGDLANFFRGDFLGGVVGCWIAGGLLLYLLRPGIRACFRASTSTES